jgi:hypothetical protein
MFRGENPPISLSFLASVSDSASSIICKVRTDLAPILV